MNHVNAIVDSKLHGVFKKVATLCLSPMIRVSNKSGCLAVEEGNFFLLSPSSSADNYDLVKITNHVSNGVLPFSKTSGVGA